MDIKAWVAGHKAATVAGGAAVAAAGYVWYRRRTGGAGGGATSSSGSAGYVGNPAAANTSASDIASWVGNTLGQYSDQMAAYQQTLSNEIAQLQQLAGQHQGPNPTPPPIWSGPAVVPAQTQGPRPFVPVVPFTRSHPAWNSTLSGISQHTGVSLPQLMQLNPDVHNPDLIHPGQKIFTG